MKKRGFVRLLSQLTWISSIDSHRNAKMGNFSSILGILDDNLLNTRNTVLVCVTFSAQTCVCGWNILFVKHKT